jgi:hypothetical protein
MDQHDLTSRDTQSGPHHTDLIDLGRFPLPKFPPLPRAGPLCLVLLRFLVPKIRFDNRFGLGGEVRVEIV